MAGSGSLLLLMASPVVPARPQWARASAWSGRVFLEKLHREDGPLSATCPAALGSALRSPHCRPIPSPLGHLTLSSVPHSWGPGSPRRCDPLMGPRCPDRGWQAGFSQPPLSGPVCQQGVQAACPRGLPILVRLSVSGSGRACSLELCQPPVLHLPLPPQAHCFPGCAVSTPQDMSARSSLGIPGPSHSRPTFQPHPALPARLVGAGDTTEARARPVAGERVPSPFGSGHDSVSLLRQGCNTGAGALAGCLSALRGRAAASVSPGTGARARAEGWPCAVRPVPREDTQARGQQETPGRTLCSPEIFSGGEAGLEERPQAQGPNPSGGQREARASVRTELGGSSAPQTLPPKVGESQPRPGP